MEITIKIADVSINLVFLEVVTFALSIAVAIAGLATGLLARKIWMMVEGELAASWRWVLPGFGIYVAASGLRTLSVFMSNKGVYPLVEKYVPFADPDKLVRFFAEVQPLSELLFLVFIVVGLVRQYRLFASLSAKE